MFAPHPNSPFFSKGICRSGQGTENQACLKQKSSAGVKISQWSFWLSHWLMWQLKSGEPNSRAAKFPSRLSARQLRLGWKHEIHIVKQCLKIEVSTEGQIFNKHKTGHTLKIFETREKVIVLQASTDSWSRLILDWIKVISPILAT